MFILQVVKLRFREFMLGGIIEVHSKIKYISSECKTYFFLQLS